MLEKRASSPRALVVTPTRELASQVHAEFERLSRRTPLTSTVIFGGVNDIFQAKQAFASSSRADGLTPSAAANLFGVTVTNAASAGTHTIEVLQTAAAHKVSSASVSSLSDPLASLEAGDVFLIDAGLGYESADQGAATDQVGSAGTLSFDTIAGATNLGAITYAATDTLNDIATNINTNVTGVTAAIVATGTGVKLEITADA